MEKEILGGSLLTAKATAEYIKGLLEEKEMDITCDMEALKYTSGAKFFDYKQKDVFPTEDFYMCTELNKFNYVLRYNRVNGVMEKIDL